MRPWWPCLTVAALLSLVPAQATENTGEWDGNLYEFAFGSGPSSNLTLVDRGAMAFEACGFMMLRPELQTGMVRVAGFVANTTPFEVLMDEFALIVVGEDVPAGAAQGEPVDADAFARGSALVRVNNRDFLDPATGAQRMSAEFLLTSRGVRDDATGALLEDPARDDEMHLLLRSLEGSGRAPDETFTFVSPAQLPDGSLAPGPHAMEYVFTNTRFGGQGRMAVAAEALGMAGDTELRFAVYSPAGRELANATVAPALLADGAATLEFPLTEFGDYRLAVQGQASLAKYTVDTALVAPDSFAIDLAWEEVVHGSDARPAFGKCERDPSVTGRVTRASPPPFALATVTVAVSIGAVGATLAVALVVAAVTFARAKRRNK